MLDVAFIAHLIRVTLTGAPFPALSRAIPLLLGTCAQESGFKYNRQLGNGPARGFWQCEPATEADIWSNFLCYNQDLAECFVARCGQSGPDVSALQHNLVYQILMARTHYFRCDPDPLPAAKDIEAHARIWKRYYNTPLGHGTESQYVQSYEALVRPYWPVRPSR
jgi:type VI secretion system secreted protein VgrG